MAFLVEAIFFLKTALRISIEKNTAPPTPPITFRSEKDGLTIPKASRTEGNWIRNMIKAISHARARRSHL